jgi:hypothetical protein
MKYIRQKLPWARIAIQQQKTTKYSDEVGSLALQTS